MNSNLASALILVTGGLVGFVGFTRPIPPAPEVEPPAGYVVPAGCWVRDEVPLAPLPRSVYVQWNDGHYQHTDRRVIVSRAFKEALGLYEPRRFDTIALCRRGVR